jgi:hypothetical protein
MESLTVVSNSNMQLPINDGLQWIREDIFIPHRSGKESFKGVILGKFFAIQKKDEGTEPGFMAIQIDNEFFKEAIHYFSKESRVREIQFLDISSFEIWLLDVLESHDKTLASFAEKIYQDIVKDKKSSPLKLFQFKQAYPDPGILNRVGPDAEQLKNSNTIKRMPEMVKPLAAEAYALARSDTPENCNFTAICESIANAIATAFGSNVQTLFLVKSAYRDGAEKLLLAGQWENRLEVFTGSLAGSKSETDYQDYLIKKDHEGKHLRNEKGQFLSDSVNDLHANLALNIAFGDRDGVGSKGQNKGRVGLDLFNFDFGKCFRENPILATLDCYFQFEQPSNTREQFKNYSVFTDANLMELLPGIFYLYRLAGESFLKSEVFSENEMDRINKIFSMYAKDENFKNRAAKIVPGAIDILFDSYLKAFDKFKDKIEDARHTMNAAVKTIMEKFKLLLMAEPVTVNILDSFRRLTLKTSETSDDGGVVLNHLRILPRSEQVIEWEIKEENENYVTYKVSGSFSDLEKAAQAIEEFLGKLEDYGMMIARINNGLEIAIKKNNFVPANFSEERIVVFKRKMLSSSSVKELENDYLLKYSETAAPLTNDSKRNEILYKEKFIFNVLNFLDSYLLYKNAWQESCDKDKNKFFASIARTVSTSLGLSKPEIREQDKKSAIHLKNRIQASIKEVNDVNKDLEIIYEEAYKIADQVENVSTDQSTFRDQMREISKKSYLLLSLNGKKPSEDNVIKSEQS